MVRCSYPVIEACVVSLRERNDEFTCPLITPINSDTCICHSLRVHQSDQLEEKIRLSLKEVGSFSFDRCLEFVGIISRNTVPRLRFTPMHYYKMRNEFLRNKNDLLKLIL